MELDFRKDPSILANIIDTMATGVFTVDVEARFVAWSHGAERITGYSNDEILGRPCHILEGTNCKGFASLSDLLGSDSPTQLSICNQECKLLAKDGRELYVVGSIRALMDESGKTYGAVGTFHDLTSFILANEKIAILQQQSVARHAFEKMVGKSAGMQDVFRRIQLAADSDVTTLITGDSGTGKELAAAAIHAKSSRHDRPFLAINCAAIPETLLESELFGHVKGAYTGAVKDKLGVFEATDGGTLFLDEIGDVGPAVQVKLLRVLQEQQIRRVGDDKTRQVDVRLVTATHQDLRALVASGKIREDFFYRIHVFEIRLPPLRERQEDIPLLVQHFIVELNQSHQRQVDGITRDAMKCIMDYHWPGNIRQLRNAIQHAMVTVTGDRVSLLDLPAELRNDAPRSSNDSAATRHGDARQQDEKRRIIDALRETHGNRTRAARLLGVSRVTLWKKITRYDIEIPH